jgi:peroxiredoxin
MRTRIHNLFLMRSFLRTLKPSILIIIIACSLLQIDASGSAAPTASQHVAGLGFTPLHYPPTNFKLPDLEGKPHRLSDYQGRWVLITFWATWCGACAKQMPSLESLYQEYKDQNFTVLAISIDDAPAEKVAAYARQRSLTFPILHDIKNEAAQIYKAQSIPTNYLLSADFNIVGMARGAINFENANALKRVGELLKLKGFEEDEIAKISSGETFELPNDLQPPSLTLANKSRYEQMDVQFDLLIGWPGNPEDYLIKVPQMTVPESVSLGPIFSSSKSRGQTSELTYHFPLTFNGEGTYQIGPIEVSYMPRAGGKELFARLSGQTIEIKRAQMSPWSAVAATLAAAFIGLTIFWRWKSKSTAPQMLSAHSHLDIEEKWLEAKKLRIQGGKELYAQSLIEILIEVRKNDGEPRDTQSLKAVLESIKFGGQKIADAQLKSYERELESTLKV